MFALNGGKNSCNAVCSKSWVKLKIKIGWAIKVIEEWFDNENI
jgi:hypothetical protein